MIITWILTGLFLVSKLNRNRQSKNGLGICAIVFNSISLLLYLPYLTCEGFFDVRSFMELVENFPPAFFIPFFVFFFLFAPFFINVHLIFKKNKEL